MEPVNESLGPVDGASTAGFYNRWWPAFGRSLHYTELMRAHFIMEGIREYAGRTDCDILDLGCGRGWMASFLAHSGSVTGTDFSPVGIEFARNNYGQFGQFVLADSAKPRLGLPDDRAFDIVVCTEVIEHVERQTEFVREIYEFLKPQGWLFLTTPNGNVQAEFCRDRRFLHALQPVENWPTPSRLSQLLRSEGFEIRLHEGRPMYECRYGRFRWLQRRSFHRLFKLAGLEHKYGRALVMDAFYQVVVAQRKD